MQKIYTSTDLIRFIYQETSITENAQIAAQLKSDMHAAEEFEALQQTLSDLSDCALQPNPTSVNIILEYSMKLHEPAH